MNRSPDLRIALVDVAWPGTGLRREAMLIVAGSLLVALLAQIRIPLQPVPITGQTFGVLLVGALLGSRLGAASMLTYLSLGAVGLPVFAGGGSSVAHFLGPTGGYLVGFIGAAFLVGWLSERGWDRRIGTTALAMFFGTLLIYIPGVAWLSLFVGFDQALRVGILPFILSDMLKIGMAALVMPWCWLLIGSDRPFNAPL